MIRVIKGKVMEKHPPCVIIDVGGLGYEVFTPMSTFYDLPAQGEEVVLQTYFVVREDAQILYGFKDNLSRVIFQILIKVNGVGPKLALALLSAMDAPTLLQVIEAENLGLLVKTPGVGKKTAERLLIETKDKFAKLAHSAATELAIVSPQSCGGALQEAVDALVALGYKSNEATKALRGLPDVANMSSEQLIRQALQQMAS